MIEREVTGIAGIILNQPNTGIVATKSLAVPGRFQCPNAGVPVRLPLQLNPVQDFLASFAKRGRRMHRIVAYWTALS